MGDEYWLLERGTEGTAVILDAEATRQTTTDSGDGQRVFKIRLRVTLPDQDPYEVDHKQWTFDHAARGDELVRVRVDPDDREHLTIDWRNPIRGLHESGPSVADILATGTAHRAVIRKCGDMLDVEPVDGKPVFDAQPGPGGRRAVGPGKGSNLRPKDYESSALTTELRPRRMVGSARSGPAGQSDPGLRP